MNAKPLNIAAELQQHNFHRWGKIISIDEAASKRLKFQPAGEATKDTRQGFVYAWIEHDLEVDPDLEGEMASICYVGKAGKLFKGRVSQHTGGFKSSQTGRELARRLNAILKAGRTVSVWLRFSEIENLFGQDVSKCHIEEIALINRWAPEWNQLKHKSE